MSAFNTNHSIQTTNGEKIEFDGKLICEATSFVALTEWDERQINVRAYARHGSGFVAVVEIRSTNANIGSVVEAERADTLENVECFLDVFDPAEHVRIRSLAWNNVGANGKTAETLRRHRLSDTYFTAVDTLVQAIHEYRKSHPDCEHVKAATPTKRASFVWRMLGLR